MQIPTPISGDLSLYFHLPFCQKKCDYCHFFVLPNKASFKEQLLKSLLIEIELRSSLLERSKIKSIYFGGGTPALVGPQYIETLLKALKIPLYNIEVTLELNPENHSLELLKGYRDAGINRLSIGVQSFDPSLLKKLGRSHSVKDIHVALDNASQAGFTNISIDLMYDLPNQSLLLWKRTLEKAVSYPITHLSLYNLSIEKETVFYKHRNQIKAEMPGEELSLTLFNEACTTFKKSGFEPYEISAFCKDGAYSRHNVGYWLQRPHLGFGPSAFSLLQPKRFQNVKNLKRYSELLDQKTLPIDFQEELKPEAFLRESLALHLRLLNGFDLSLFQKRFGAFTNELSDVLELLIERGWIKREQNTLSLTEDGILYHDSVASELVC